jgi:hypothetical protein
VRRADTHLALLLRTAHAIFDDPRSVDLAIRAKTHAQEEVAPISIKPRPSIGARLGIFDLVRRQAI